MAPVPWAGVSQRRPVFFYFLAKLFATFFRVSAAERATHKGLSQIHLPQPVQ